MREESHLDEMRAAIRGDFERLERRRGGQELMHVSELAEEDEQQAERAREPVSSAEHSEAGARHLGSQAPEPPPEEPPGEEPPSEEPPQTTVEPAPEDEPRRTWLDRLLGR